MKKVLDPASALILAVAFFIYGGIVGQALEGMRSADKPRALQAGDEHKSCQRHVDQHP